MSDYDDEPDRAAILQRRALLLATVTVGFALTLSAAQDARADAGGGDASGQDEDNLPSVESLPEVQLDATVVTVIPQPCLSPIRDRPATRGCGCSGVGRSGGGSS
ncbi:MAG: hypothetical protein Q8Q09_19030 [Deltaproteobacteria bacterium]|nr:hypothetical protein [Deltaproteobacteria bacterium]